MASVTHLPIRFSDGEVMPMTPELIEFGKKLRERAERENWHGSNEESTVHKRYLHAAITTEQLAHDATANLATHEQISEPLPANYNAAEIDTHIRQRIQTGALKALQVLEDIIEGRLPASTALRAKYASLHLARAGYGPLTRVNRVDQHLTHEDIEALKQRCSEASSNEQE